MPNRNTATGQRRKADHVQFYSKNTGEYLGPHAEELFYDDFHFAQPPVKSGTVTLDGTNPTPITTGLNAVVAATASLNDTSTPGDDPTSHSVNVSGGTVNLYAYKTDGTDPTLVASTDSAATFDWVATGYSIGKGCWDTVQVNLNTAVANVSDAGSYVDMIVDADSNAEDAVVFFGNNRAFNAKAGLIAEFSVTAQVLPTTGVAAVWGMCGDHNLDKDTIAENAWFRLQASGALLVESDDTTNNNDDTSTGTTLVAAAEHLYTIDFTDMSSVKFFLDGARVAAGTTFDMSNLTDAEAWLQPYFSLDKASGTGVGTLRVNHVRLFSKRSA